MFISYSRASLYLRCPYAHYLRYVEGLENIKPARPLHFGSDFHKLLEVRENRKQVKKEWKEMKDNFYRMPASWQSELGNDYPYDLKTIFQDYMHKWKDAPLPDSTEQKFELEIAEVKGEPIVFVGVIDELYDTPKGVIIGEHKTFTRPPDMNTLVMNTQKCLYAKAVELIYGEKPQKIRWDYIKSTPAKAPVWLEKSQRFSLSKSKDITPRSWKRACKDKGITDPAILEQGIELYSGNENNFFFRVEQDLYPQMVEDIYAGFVYTCKDIVNREENTTKNVTRDCAWCGYRDICMAEMSGGDREHTIKEKFKTKER